MLPVGSLEGWRLWLVAFCIVTVAAGYLALAAGPLAHILLALAFGAAVINIVISEQSSGVITTVDLALLFATGFAASAYAVPSGLHEFLYAFLRMAALGAAVAALAWLYFRWRGIAALSVGDILLIAILGAFLPFAIAIYAVAFAITLTIAAVAVLHLLRGEKADLRQQLPIASTLSLLYFCIWVAYQLKSDVTL